MSANATPPRWGDGIPHRPAEGRAHGGRLTVVTHQDRPDDEPMPIELDGGREETEYELDDWSREGRQLLERVLVAAELPHVWQGGLLIIRRENEARVDELIDEVQIATLPTLAPDGERVVYEVAEWVDDAKFRLGDALDDAGVAWEWDAMGDLVVDEPDEETVDEVIDGLDLDESETEAGAESEDGLSATEILNELFVAADRLRRNARDHNGVLTIVDRTADLEGVGLPYGFDRKAWDELVRRGVALRTLFESEDDVADEEINEQASDYRQALHRYI